MAEIHSNKEHKPIVLKLPLAEFTADSLGGLFKDHDVDGKTAMEIANEHARRVMMGFRNYIMFTEIDPIVINPTAEQLRDLRDFHFRNKLTLEETTVQYFLRATYHLIYQGYRRYPMVEEKKGGEKRQEDSEQKGEKAPKEGRVSKEDKPRREHRQSREDGKHHEDRAQKGERAHEKEKQLRRR